MKDSKYFSKLRDNVHSWAVEVGWWSTPRNPLTMLQLVVTEVAEATEGARRDQMDDHLPHRKMEEVELADTMIRLMDFCGFYGIEFSDSYCDAHRWTVLGSGEPGEMHLGIVSAVIAFANIFDQAIINNDQLYVGVLTPAVMGLIRTIEWAAQERGYDLYSAIDEKMAYNRKREDHKLENRMKEGGKKF